MDRLTDRTAVITGAGSGIGRALALELARRGATLALSDWDLPSVEQTAAMCTAVGATAKVYELDVRDGAAVVAHADDVEAEFGSVHLVINNAGVALAASATEQTLEQARKVIEVDLMGVVHGTQAFLPKLIASGDGNLVNISSIYGLLAMPKNSAYSAAKFGVRGYTEAVAVELEVARAPVTVTCVHPGGIDTDIARNAEKAPGNEQLAAAFERVLWMSPERAARIILRGVERGRRRLLVGPDAWALHVLQTVLGARAQRVVALAARPILGRGR